LRGWPFSTIISTAMMGINLASRRAILGGIGIASLAGVAIAARQFRGAMAATRARLAGRGTSIETSAGALEYAEAGDGPPVLMIHGTGGGFDQGLLFGQRLAEGGHRLLAPSRFGYLGSSFPADASPQHQADVLVELLDQLGIARLVVAGGSAGALTAAAFAERHPARTSHLILLAPAANLTGRDPVVFSAVQQLAVDQVLQSDLALWFYATAAPDHLLRTLLATPPGLLAAVSDAERARAAAIRDGLMPISRKTAGLRNDGHWAGAPCTIRFERISCPTLIMSCRDDLFGTAETAQQLQQRMPQATLQLFETGGHIWLGHDAEVASAIAGFVARPAPEPGDAAPG
jgi:pimeloyl-ACP methyl ester carboxylesterase